MTYLVFDGKTCKGCTVDRCSQSLTAGSWPCGAIGAFCADSPPAEPTAKGPDDRLHSFDSARRGSSAPTPRDISSKLRAVNPDQQRVLAYIIPVPGP